MRMLSIRSFILIVALAATASASHTDVNSGPILRDANMLVKAYGRFLGTPKAAHNSGPSGNVNIDGLTVISADKTTVTTALPQMSENKPFKLETLQEAVAAFEKSEHKNVRLQVTTYMWDDTAVQGLEQGSVKTPVMRYNFNIGNECVEQEGYVKLSASGRAQSDKTRSAANIRCFVLRVDPLM